MKKNVLQLEWARDCKANDYVYLGQVSRFDETKDINQTLCCPWWKYFLKISGHDLWTTLAVWTNPSSQLQDAHE